MDRLDKKKIPEYIKQSKYIKCLQLLACNFNEYMLRVKLLQSIPTVCNMDWRALQHLTVQILFRFFLNYLNSTRNFLRTNMRLSVLPAFD